MLRLRANTEVSRSEFSTTSIHNPCSPESTFPGWAFALQGLSEIVRVGFHLSVTQSSTHLFVPSPQFLPLRLPLSLCLIYVMTGLWSLTQAPDSLCSGMALSGGGRLYVSMCDGVMLTVLGAELGKLTFSGVLNRYFTEERLLYQTWKVWGTLKSP